MSKIRYAFIVHSRDRKDLLRKYSFLKYLPQSAFDLLTLYLPPFKVSRITGLTTAKGEKVDGLIIGVPMTAHQLVERRSMAIKRIIQAVNVGKKHGATFIGLGAMTASLTRSGKDVVEGIPDVFITTGRTYTIKNIVDYVENCIGKFNLNVEQIRVGIIGAAGGIGSGTAIALARKGYKHFILIDLERKLSHLKKHIEILEKHENDLTIQISHQVSLVKDCQIIIAATSAPEVILTSNDVSAGTIIINDAQPSDVSPEIISHRNDVIVIEGGVLNTPNIDCHFDLGLAHKHDIFSCLAETLVLSYEDKKGHYSVESFDENYLEELEKSSNILGFTISPFQNERGYLSENHLIKFAKIIEQRHNSTIWTP